MLFIYFLIFFWLIRTIKAGLFWIYLWQLKDYHFGRFLDHFRTKKGKTIFLNYIFLIKVILLILAIPLIVLSASLDLELLVFWLSVLLFIYIFESIKFALSVIKRNFIRPILTQKTIALIVLFFFALIFFLYFLFKEFLFISSFGVHLLVFYLLLADILIPILVLLIIFFVDFFVIIFFKKRTNEKAKFKIAKHPNLLVIGVTGSFGKTSTKEFLFEILKDRFKVLKTKKHQNTEVGISLGILKELKDEHQVFICEMASHNKGGIKLLCGITGPKIGIITGINEQHLSTFGSMENLISAEGGEELIDSLPKDGIVIFNGNNKHCLKIYSETKKEKRIIFNTSNNKIADLWVEDIKVNKNSISFNIMSKDKEKVFIIVNLLGKQNIDNILLAVATAKELGMSLQEIAVKCKNFKAFQKQMEFKNGKNSLNIIDSTYSSNPDGVFAHLDYLKSWLGNKILIMPCLIELGKESKRLHYEIGKKIGEVCNIAIITTRERFEDVKDGAIAGGMGRENILFLEDEKKIFEKIKDFKAKEDIILLEGRSSENIIKIILNE